MPFIFMYIYIYVCMHVYAHLYLSVYLPIRKRHYLASTLQDFQGIKNKTVKNRYSEDETKDS